MFLPFHEFFFWPIAKLKTADFQGTNIAEL